MSIKIGNTNIKGIKTEINGSEKNIYCILMGNEPAISCGNWTPGLRFEYIENCYVHTRDTEIVEGKTYYTNVYGYAINDMSYYSNPKKEHLYEKVDGGAYAIEQSNNLVMDNGILIIPGRYCDGTHGFLNTYIKTYGFRSNTNIKKVIYDENLLYVGEHAFADCTELESFKSKNTSNLRTIDSYAFNSCSKLNKIDYNKDTLLDIGYWAFYNTGLSSIDIPLNMSEIKDNCFNSTKITNLYIPDNIITIGKDAFSFCDELKEISFSSKTKLIKTDAFIYTTKLERVIIRDIDEYTSSTKLNINENSFSLGSENYGSPTAKIWFPGTSTDWNNVVNCEDISITNDRLYFNYNNLTDACFSLIDNGNNDKYWAIVNLQKIEDSDSTNTFYIPALKKNDSDDNLYTVKEIRVIPQSSQQMTDVFIPSTVITIVANAFENLKVEEIIIPNSVQTINSGLFKNNQYVKNIILEEGIYSISNDAFANMSKLISLSIPSTINSIGYGAFSNCKNVVTINVSNPKYEIINDCIIDKSDANAKCVVAGLRNNSTTTTSVIPTTSSVTKIGSKAYLGCVGITNLEIPNNILEIGESVLSGCSNIANLSIPFTGSSYNVDSSDIEKINFGYLFGTTSWGVNESYQISQNYKYGSTKTYYLPNELNSITITRGNRYTYTTDERCSGLYERSIQSKVDESQNIIIKYDDCCNPFAVYFGDFGNVSSIQKHTNNEASSTILNSVSNIVEKYNTYMEKYMDEDLQNSDGFFKTGTAEMDNDYKFELMSVDMSNLFRDNALIDRSRFSIDYAKCALIGLNYNFTLTKDYRKVPGLNDASGEVDYQSLAMKLFGFNSKNNFMNYAQSISNIYQSYRNNSSNSIPAYTNGCFNINGTYVYPLKIQNNVKNNNTGSLLAMLFFDTRGYVSLWISNTDAAYTILNYTEVYTQYAEIFCKNILFVDGKKTKTEDNSIINYAFSNSSYNNEWEYTNIVLSNNIRYIGSSAFQLNRSLTNITLSSNLEKINDNAFSMCTTLDDVTIPQSVTYIGSNAFDRCIKLSNIVFQNNINITTLNSGVFGGCTNLESINLPNSITKICNAAFSGCDKLYDITLPDNLLYLGELNTGMVGVFTGCIKLKNIQLNTALLQIGYSAFSRTGLTSITIPQNVKTISEYAFASCSSLSAMLIKSIVLEWIGGYFVSGIDDHFDIYYVDSENSWNSINKDNLWDNGLNDYTIHYNVVLNNTAGVKFTYVESGSYYAVTGFTPSRSGGAVYIASIYDDGIHGIHIVKEIGDNAFKNQSISSLSMPLSITTIGSYAFANCSISSTLQIPNSVTEIKEYAFNGSNTNISFEENSIIDNIGQNVFNGYLGSSIIIPSSVQIISNNAFENCTNLTSLTLPVESLNNIDETAFKNCSNLTNIYSSGGTSIKYIIINKCVIDTVTNGIVIGCKNSVIPETYTFNGSTVTLCNIQPYAFYGNTQINTMSIPDTITKISQNSFKNCTNLTDIYYIGTFNSWSTNVTKENGWWHDNESENSVCFMIDNSGFKYTFKSDNTLNIAGYLNNNSTVTIPESYDIRHKSTPLVVAGISSGAFTNNTNITTIILHANIVDIYNGFTGCSNLIDIKFTGTLTQWCSINGLTYITERSNSSLKNFYINSTKLTNIDIRGITDIKEGAFCSFNIEKVTLNNITSTQSTYASIFNNCSSLINIYFSGTIAEWCSKNKRYILDANSQTKSLYLNSTHITTLDLRGITSMSNYIFQTLRNITTVRTNDTIVSVMSSYMNSGITDTGINKIIHDGTASTWCAAFYPSVSNTLTITALEINSYTSSGTSTANTIKNANSAVKQAYNGQNLNINSIYITPYSYYGCTLDAVTLSDDCHDIGTYAFAYSDINTFTNNTYAKLGIEDSAFEGANLPASITIPTHNYDKPEAGYSLVLGESIFKNATGKDVDNTFSITFSGNMDVIPKHMFNGSNLKNMSFTHNNTGPKIVRTVKAYAFYNCKYLTGSYNFRGDSHDATSTKNGVFEIGPYAFYNCGTIGGATFSFKIWFKQNAVTPNSRWVVYRNGYGYSLTDKNSGDYLFNKLKNNTKYNFKYNSSTTHYDSIYDKTLKYGNISTYTGLFERVVT